MDRVQIKTNSKYQLGGGIFKNSWLMALVIELVAGAVISAGSIIPVVGSILISGPIFYGKSKEYLKLARGERSAVDIGGLFDGFRDDFSGTFMIGLMTSIFITLWSLLFVIPGIVMSYAYSMAYYIKVDHPEYDWNRCIQESKRLTNGHKGELFMLDLSFIGWVIVGGLCGGVGMLWVNPYMTAAKTNAYLYLLEADVASTGTPY